MRTLKYPALIVSLLLVMWLAGYIIFLARVTTAEIDKPIQKSDAIIVLTGGSKRIATGIKLLRQEYARHLLISGVDRRVTREDVLARHQLPEALLACCITLGRQARNTPGNAREAYDWVQDNNITSLRLVTSHYHIDRARLEFNAMMPGLHIETHPVRPANFDMGYRHFWLLTFEEYNKLLYRLGFHVLGDPGKDRDQGDKS